MNILVSSEASNLPRVQRARKRILFAIFFLIACTLPFVRSLWSWQGPVQEWIENIGFSLVLIAIIGRCWASLYIGGRKIQELVTEGPFSIVRNPLYVFSFIGTIGMGACSGSITLAMLFFFLAFVIFRPVVLREEAALRAIFGQEYIEYCRRVPRFLPDIRRWNAPQKLEIEPARVVRTLFDAAPFILAMPLFELLGELQLQGILPVLLRLP
ncbi:protein-S-isoprenylcysteine O-methyltransferase Ste14 [Mesorhizobium sp. J18]|uniref:methyltransferase family protein n=1 Tax=Mesorhizobium sp. J18 TaxID=935263 RepID=UPI00119976CA|nr:isoprenylcysteine carboxylmethyltransferase family protein [Mesorhizobium sp. J18]TWG92766.1 protein-S-isoprenylcysteine O-methyltransferase Ste14 [Mesorhizobium sp. J18]